VVENEVKFTPARPTEDSAFHNSEAYLIRLDKEHKSSMTGSAAVMRSDYVLTSIHADGTRRDLFRSPDLEELMEIVKEGLDSRRLHLDLEVANSLMHEDVTNDILSEMA